MLIGIIFNTGFPSRSYLGSSPNYNIIMDECFTVLSSVDLLRVDFAYTMKMCAFPSASTLRLFWVDCNPQLITKREPQTYNNPYNRKLHCSKNTEQGKPYTKQAASDEKIRLRRRYFNYCLCRVRWEADLCLFLRRQRQYLGSKK